MATWSSSSGPVQGIEDVKAIPEFSAQQLAALVRAFPDRKVTEESTMSAIQNNAGRQAVIEWVRLHTQGVRHVRVK